MNILNNIFTERKRVRVRVRERKRERERERERTDLVGKDTLPERVLVRLVID